MTSRETPPPPVIGKAGRYTVFITPPPTPRPSESSRSRNSSPSPSPSPKFSSPRNVANLSPRVGDLSPTKGFEKPAVVVEPPPPVQVPPPQFEKGKRGKESGSMFGFFWDAVAKVQDAHSSLDQYLAEWLGLDQSRYQWALNDYYENNGSGKDGGKPKELVSKGQDA